MTPEITPEIAEQLAWMERQIDRGADPRDLVHPLCDFCRPGDPCGYYHYQNGEPDTEVSR